MSSEVISHEVRLFTSDGLIRQIDISMYWPRRRIFLGSQLGLRPVLISHWFHCFNAIFTIRAFCLINVLRCVSSGLKHLHWCGWDAIRKMFLHHVHVLVYNDPSVYLNDIHIYAFSLWGFQFLFEIIFGRWSEESWTEMLKKNLIEFVWRETLKQFHFSG